MCATLHNVLHTGLFFVVFFKSCYSAVLNHINGQMKQKIIVQTNPCTHQTCLKHSCSAGQYLQYYILAIINPRCGCAVRSYCNGQFVEIHETLQ